MNFPRVLRSPEEPSAGCGASPRRAASVTLREGASATQAEASLMDPANQSLADALRLMLWLVYAAMTILVVLYLFSGLGRVKEGARGIRLLFGRVVASDLEPGFQYSAPFPIGELLTVDQGYQDFELDKEFWAYVPENTVDSSPDRLSPTPSLKPDQGGSGSVLTADGNIAHTKWKVSYHRSNVAWFSENVLDEDEQKIVRMAARRGVVQACATVPIGDLLTQSAENSAAAARARAIAQASLEAFNSGLEIDTLSLTSVIPPLYVRTDFARVQSAAANAAKAIDAARGEARNTLLGTAGEASDYLIHAINQYERAVAAKDEALMGKYLATIDALLLGKEVEMEPATLEIAGHTVRLPGGMVKSRVGGRVAEVLAEAATYRTTVVNRTNGDLRRFQAKLEQYNANPSLMIRRDWASAVGSFMTRDSVQTMLLPLGVHTLNLQINVDPDLQRELEISRKRRERQQTEQERKKMLEKDQFKTQPGTTELSS